MADKRPPWLQDVDNVDNLDDLDDRARYAAMSAEARLRIFAEVCEVADAILADRPDREAVLGRTEPMSDEAARTWKRLVAESMRERDTR